MRLAMGWPCACQVGQREAAGVGRVALHLGDDGLGHFTFEQRLGAVASDVLEHGRQFGVLEHMAHGPGFVGCVEEVRTRGRVLGQVFFVGQQRVQARAHLEAAFRQLDGRLEQRCPGQLAVLLVRQLQHAHRAGRAHRAAPDDAVVESDRLAARPEKQVFIGGSRGRFAAVVGLDLAAARVQQKGPATDAARLRLDQREHHLHRDGSIDGRASGLENLVARVAGERIGGSDGELLRRPAGLFGVAGGGFGLVGLAGWRVAQPGAGAAGREESAAAARMASLAAGRCLLFMAVSLFEVGAMVRRRAGLGRGCYTRLPDGRERTRPRRCAAMALRVF